MLDGHLVVLLLLLVDLVIHQGRQMLLQDVDNFASWRARLTDVEWRLLRLWFLLRLFLGVFLLIRFQLT